MAGNRRGPEGDIRFDKLGEMRCYWCGARSFREKRQFVAKATLGVAALLTKKKMCCHRCGTYNRTGAGQPWTGPAAPGRWWESWDQDRDAARRYRAEYEAECREADDASDVSGGRCP